MYSARISKFYIKLKILHEIWSFDSQENRIVRLKCTKFNFGWGSAPDPAGGAFRAPPDLLAKFKRPTFKGEEGKGCRMGGGDERDGEGVKRKGPQTLVHTPMSEILNNTLIAELI